MFQTDCRVDRLRKCSLASMVIVTMVTASIRHGVAQRPPSRAQPISPPSVTEMLNGLPERFFVPARNAIDFSQPTRNSFADAATTETGRRLRGRIAVQHLNGGYGVKMDVGGRMLFHTGADLGWFDTGDEVFAIADGVVRHSGPGLRAQLADMGIKTPIRGPVDYGNFIVIEQRVDGDLYRSLYGHLADNRLVRTGDVVSAGQMIGSIGRKSGVINGGYEPHVHVGVHEGGALPIGIPIARIPWQGGAADFTLEEYSETELTLRVPNDLQPINMQIGPDYTVRIEPEEGECRIPAQLAWAFAARGAAIPGYTNSLDGFRDPIDFVRSGMRDHQEAPLYYVSTHRPLDTPSVVGKAAIDWEVDQWMNTSDDDALTLERAAGQVVCIVCVQCRCRGSQTHAWPALKKLEDELAGRNDVTLFGLQTTFTQPTRNNFNNLKRVVEKAGLTIPFGQMSKVSREFGEAYGLRGTPWVILIDRSGVIQFSNFLVRPTELLPRIDELTDDTE